MSLMMLRMDMTTFLRFFAFCAILNLLASFSIAQKINAGYQLHMRKATSPIRIDGVLDEQAWLDAEVATDFYMVLPMDTSRAEVRTDVRMTYDEDNIYLIATCYHKLQGRYIVESLKRDFSFGNNDNFLVFIDPFDDQTNGFSFGANAAGAQWDGIMYNGSKVDLSWDNKWTSVVKSYDDRYIFEMAIPFKTIRYKKGITNWGINFSRLDLKTTEKSSWTPVPRQFPTAALAYTGTLVWDQPPPSAGSNISIIPYALGGISKDFENNVPRQNRKEIGGDAKIAITSSLNLDLTVNPDFSQVDVDDQVTNLDRFELFFPEKRQFFLENGDLFADFGYETIRPFFSRRIGLGVPIQFGARLSGRINKNWRIGAMDIQTDKVDSLALPSQNFAVFAIQRKVFARSNIGLVFINKESLNYQPSDDPDVPTYSNYNRNIGLEYNLASPNNFWTGKALLFKSMSPGTSDKDITHAANLRYATRKWDISWRHEYVGENYNAEVGYVPRNGYMRVNPEITRILFPTSKKILSHSVTAGTSNYFDTSFKQTDYRSLFTYKITFRSRSTLSGWISPNYVKLLGPFDPTNTGGDTLATGSEYHWVEYGADYISKPQSLFTFTASVQNGGYYNGERFRITAEAGYRFQPYVKMTVRATYDDIKLPEPLKSAKLWLIGPRIDVTMTNKLFFTAFAQYNEQQDNFNLNTRFQWRYRPASDLFIVYTDNYIPGGMVKNRSLVVKLTYWWNI
jgi:Domain of unknown function (DUF5916)/Carbohydrate family 9 binding domain-like